MVTDEQVREIALQLRDAEEKSHFGHPDFRVKNRIFATLWPGQCRSVLKLPPEDQAASVLSQPDVFSIPAGGERGGWTNVKLEKVDEEQFRELIRKAWAALPRPRPRKELARKRAAGGSF
jgi:predicted DNA-binding protein (MmcQ/YjbR family)